MQLTQRIIEPERMDDPDVDREALGRALTYLARMNRFLGGTRQVVRIVERWRRAAPRDQVVRIIDLGTGSGDIPIALADWAHRTGQSIHITAIDLHERTLDFARESTAECENIEIIRADARGLMDHFAPNSFDIAHAGLFLHHLQDIEVLTVLRIMQRLASRGLIWNDLIRSWFTKLAVRPSGWVGPEIVRHDAIASINAGFTKREALDIAQRVGLTNVRYRTHLFHRFLLTSEKKTG